MESNTCSEQMLVLALHPTRGLEFVCVEVQLEMGLMQSQDKNTEAFSLASALGYLPIVAFAADDPAGKQILGLSLIPGLIKPAASDTAPDTQTIRTTTEGWYGLDQCQIQMLQSETLRAACANLNQAYHAAQIATYGFQNQS